MITIRLQKIFLMVMWPIAGVLLYAKGAVAISKMGDFPLMQLGLLVLGYLLGEVKARLILQKSANRDPLPKDFILIAFMMLFGITIANLSLPIELRSLLQIGVGFALIRGAVFRWRHWVECDQSVVEK
ncbi:MAG: hypothetical protein ACOYK9_02480 [Chlamydiia bacterium]